MIHELHASEWRNIDWYEVRGGDTFKINGTCGVEGQKIQPFEVKHGNITIEGPADFYGYYLASNGIHGLTFRNLHFWDSGQIRSQGGSHYWFDRCWFRGLRPSNDIFVQLGPGNDYWTFKNCVVEGAGDAIYTKIEDGQAANRLWVEGCTLRDLHGRDGHGVGIQGGSNHVISNNRIHNCGTAITCWGSFNLPMTDIEITGNLIYNCEIRDIATGSGIEISGSHEVDLNLPKPLWRSGIRIIRNMIHDVQGWGISTNIRDPFVDVGNLIYAAGAGKRRNANPFKGEVGPLEVE